MAKSKRNQNTAKPLSTVQTAHSYSLSSSTDYQSSSIVSYAPAPAAPGEEAGVCVVCEDECTCGAAAAAASKATVSSLTTKKRLILKVPKPAADSASVDAPGGGNVHSIHSSSLLPAPPSSRFGANLPKKRGRPSKADLNARQAAARAARAALPSALRRTTAVAAGVNKKPRVPSAPVRPIVPTASDDLPILLSSSTSGLPTFVPASVFGSDSSLSSPSSESDDSSSSSSSSDDMLDDDDTDSEVEAEEERLIVQETLAMQKLRARRELEKSSLEGEANNGRRRWDKMHWTHGDRHGSVGVDHTLTDGDSSSDDGSNSGSSGDDEQEEDEDGEDDNDDAELDASSAPGYDWSDDEDDFDADVFFANLSDSSFDSSSSDSEPDQPRNLQISATSRESGMSLAEAVDAGLVSETELQNSQPLPLVVTENWDGQLIFADGIKDGDEMLDVIFGPAVRGNDAVITSEPDSMHDADEQETEEAETDTVDHEDEDDYEEFGLGIDEGDTTDEDELHPELGPILFSNSPFNVISGAPSIFSSNRQPARDKHRRHTSASGELATSLRLTPALSSSGSTMSESGRLIPAMGSFAIATDASVNTLSAVIDGTRAVTLPSPYPVRQQRKRRPLEQNDTPLRKRVRSSSRRTTPTPRSSSRGLNGDTLAYSSDTGNSTEDTRPRTPPRPLPEPIDLGDVLHILDDQLSDPPANTSGAQSNRWDRIPFNAFHRLRSASLSHSGVLGSPVNTTVTMTSAMSTPHPSDDFPYQRPSTMSTPYSGYGSLWSTSPQSSPRPATRSIPIGARNPRRHTVSSSGSKIGTTERGTRKMFVSPVLLPTREGPHGRELDALNLDGGTTPTQHGSPIPSSKRVSAFPS